MLICNCFTVPGGLNRAMLLTKICVIGLKFNASDLWLILSKVHLLLAQECAVWKVPT